MSRVQNGMPFQAVIKVRAIIVRSVDFGKVKREMREGPILVDGRRMNGSDNVIKNGLIYTCIGKA